MASKKHNDPIQDAQFKDTTPKPTAVAVVEQPVAHHQQVGNPLDMPVAVFQEALERRSANRTALMRTIKDMLIIGVDYGPIHVKKKSDCKYYGPPDCTPEKEPYHWSKPVLFKPGAEKICGFLGVTTIYPNYPEYERAALEGTEVKQIILRCHLVSGGNVVADGIGARHVEKDYGDLNKALKMASKSAHIAATLNMAGLSEVFTQDLEDMFPDGNPPAPGGAEAEPEPTTLTMAQVTAIDKALDNYTPVAKDKFIKTICKAYQVEALAEISAKLYDEVLARITAAKQKAAKPSGTRVV